MTKQFEDIVIDKLLKQFQGHDDLIKMIIKPLVKLLSDFQKQGIQNGHSMINYMNISKFIVQMLQTKIKNDRSCGAVYKIGKQCMNNLIKGKINTNDIDDSTVSINDSAKLQIQQTIQKLKNQYQGKIRQITDNANKQKEQLQNQICKLKQTIEGNQS